MFSTRRYFDTVGSIMVTTYRLISVTSHVVVASPEALGCVRCLLSRVIVKADSQDQEVEHRYCSHSKSMDRTHSLAISSASVSRISYILKPMPTYACNLGSKISDFRHSNGDEDVL
ncbi:unnamed protein product [Ectocarpus sp. 12 AP-2014]